MSRPASHCRARRFAGMGTSLRHASITAMLRQPASATTAKKTNPANAGSSIVTAASSSRPTRRLRMARTRTAAGIASRAASRRLPVASWPRPGQTNDRTAGVTWTQGASTQEGFNHRPGSLAQASGNSAARTASIKGPGGIRTWAVLIFAPRGPRNEPMRKPGTR